MEQLPRATCTGNSKRGTQFKTCWSRDQIVVERFDPIAVDAGLKLDLVFSGDFHERGEGFTYVNYKHMSVFEDAERGTFSEKTHAFEAIERENLTLPQLFRVERAQHAAILAVIHK